MTERTPQSRSRPSVPAHRGFTLLEMVAALLLTAILASIAALTYNAVVNKTKATTARTQAESIGRSVLALAINDESNPRTGPQLTSASGEYVNTIKAELSTQVTAALSATFSTTGKVTVTASSTSACLTLPNSNSGKYTVTDGTCT